MGLRYKRSFTAVRPDFVKVTIQEWVEVLDNMTGQGPLGSDEGLTWLRLADGTHVERVGKGKYEYDGGAGQISLTTTDPTAP